MQICPLGSAQLQLYKNFIKNGFLSENIFLKFYDPANVGFVVNFV